MTSKGFYEIAEVVAKEGARSSLFCLEGKRLKGNG